MAEDQWAEFEDVGPAVVEPESQDPWAGFEDIGPAVAPKIRGVKKEFDSSEFEKFDPEKDSPEDFFDKNDADYEEKVQAAYRLKIQDATGKTFANNLKRYQDQNKERQLGGALPKNLLPTVEWGLRNMLPAGGSAIFNLTDFVGPQGFSGSPGDFESNPKDAYKYSMHLASNAAQRAALEQAMRPGPADGSDPETALGKAGKFVGEAGQLAARSAPFAVDMLLAGGAGAAGESAAVSKLAQGAAMTAAHAPSNLQGRVMPQVSPEGQVQPGEQMGPQVVAKALLDAGIESATEMIGGEAGPQAINKYLVARGLKALPESVAKRAANAYNQMRRNGVTNVMSQAGFDGIVAEMGEERMGELMRVAVSESPLSLGKPEDVGGVSYDLATGKVGDAAYKLGVEAASFGIPGVVGTGVGALTRKKPSERPDWINSHAKDVKDTQYAEYVAEGINKAVDAGTPIDLRQWNWLEKTFGTTLKRPDGFTEQDGFLVPSQQPSAKGVANAPPVQSTPQPVVGDNPEPQADAQEQPETQPEQVAKPMTWDELLAKRERAQAFIEGNPNRKKATAVAQQSIEEIDTELARRQQALQSFPDEKIDQMLSETPDGSPTQQRLLGEKQRRERAVQESAPDGRMGKIEQIANTEGHPLQQKAQQELGKVQGKRLFQKPEATNPAMSDNEKVSQQVQQFTEDEHKHLSLKAGSMLSPDSQEALADLVLTVAGKPTKEIKLAIVKSGLSDNIAVSDLVFLAESISQGNGEIAERTLRESANRQREKAASKKQKSRSEEIQDEIALIQEAISSAENLPIKETTTVEDFATGDMVVVRRSERSIQKSKDDRSRFVASKKEQLKALRSQLQQLEAEQPAREPKAKPTEQFDTVSNPAPDKSPVITVGQKASGSLESIRQIPGVAERLDSENRSGETIGQHTENVLRNFTNNVAPDDLKSITSAVDASKVMPVVIALHDIGKADAIKAGDKSRQHEFTIPLVQKLLRDAGFNEAEMNVAVELIGNDAIGEMLKGKISPQKAAASIAESAGRANIPVEEFFKLQTLMYKSDAGAYPALQKKLFSKKGDKMFVAKEKFGVLEEIIYGQVQETPWIGSSAKDGREQPIGGSGYRGTSGFVHGTGTEFDSFSVEYDSGRNVAGPGVYLLSTEDSDVAEHYADRAMRKLLALFSDKSRKMLTGLSGEQFTTFIKRANDNAKILAKGNPKESARWSEAAQILQLMQEGKIGKKVLDVAYTPQKIFDMGSHDASGRVITAEEQNEILANLPGTFKNHSPQRAFSFYEALAKKFGKPAVNEAILSAGYDTIHFVHKSGGYNRPYSVFVALSHQKAKIKLAKEGESVPDKMEPDVVAEQPAAKPGFAIKPADRGENSAFAKAFEEAFDTRGKGVQYHGTKGKIGNLSEGYYNDKNIYGGEGTFYTTDAFDIARGYRRKSKDGTVYEVQEKEPVKFFDMEQKLPIAEVMGLFGDDRNGLVEMAVSGVSKDGTASLRDVMDEFRDQSKSEGLTRDDVQEYFSSVTYNLGNQGYGGMSHVGGAITGKNPHTVKIYFDPANQISVEEVSKPKQLGQKPQEPIEPAPKKKLFQRSPEVTAAEPVRTKAESVQRGEYPGRGGVEGKPQAESLQQVRQRYKAKIDAIDAEFNATEKELGRQKSKALKSRNKGKVADLESEYRKAKEDTSTKRQAIFSEMRTEVESHPEYIAEKADASEKAKVRREQTDAQFKATRERVDRETWDDIQKKGGYEAAKAEIEGDLKKAKKSLAMAKESNKWKFNGRITGIEDRLSYLDSLKEKFGEPEIDTVSKPPGTGGDKNIGREWDSPYGRQRIVSFSGVGSPMYSVETVGSGDIRNYSANRIEDVIRRNEYELTPEYKAEVEEDKAIAADRAAARKVREEKEAKVKAEIAEFTAGKPAIEAGRMSKTLMLTVKYNGNVKTRKQMIEGVVDGGAKVVSASEGRRLEKPDGSFLSESTTTKIGMNYAEWLIARKTKDGGETEKPQLASPVEEKAESPKAESQPNQELTKWLIDEAQRYQGYADKYSGGKGIAVGSEGINYQFKADALREFRDAINRGESPEQAESSAKAKAREWITAHNSRRKKDINWQRWEGAADDVIENAVRKARELDSAKEPAKPNPEPQSFDRQTPRKGTPEREAIDKKHSDTRKVEGELAEESSRLRDELRKVKSGTKKEAQLQKKYDDVQEKLRTAVDRENEKTRRIAMHEDAVDEAKDEWLRYIAIDRLNSLFSSLDIKRRIPNEGSYERLKDAAGKEARRLGVDKDRAEQIGQDTAQEMFAFGKDTMKDTVAKRVMIDSEEKPYRDAIKELRATDVSGKSDIERKLDNYRRDPERINEIMQGVRREVANEKKAKEMADAMISDAVKERSARAYPLSEVKATVANVLPNNILPVGADYISDGRFAIKKSAINPKKAKAMLGRTANEGASVEVANKQFADFFEDKPQGDFEFVGVVDREIIYKKKEITIPAAIYVDENGDVKFVDARFVKYLEGDYDQVAKADNNRILFLKDGKPIAVMQGIDAENSINVAIAKKAVADKTPAEPAPKKRIGRKKKDSDKPEVAKLTSGASQLPGGDGMNPNYRGPKDTEPGVSFQQLKDTWTRIFGTPIRLSYFNAKGAMGIYKYFFGKTVDVARLSTHEASSAAVAAHEIAHGIDKKHKITYGNTLSPSIINELVGWDHSQQNKPEEGVAEYMRFRLLHPDGEAEARFPQFHSWFENWLGKHPDLRKKLDEGRKYGRMYAEQPEYQRFAAAIGNAGDDLSPAERWKKKALNAVSETDRLLFDKDRPWAELTKFLKAQGGDFTKDLTPEEVQRNYSGTAGHRSEDAFINGPESIMSNKRFGPGLVEIKELVNTEGELQEAYQYSWARHVLFIAEVDPNWNGGMTVEQAQKIMDATKAEAGDRYEKFAVKLSEYAFNLSRVEVDAGMKTQAEFDFEFKKYGNGKYYLPMERQHPDAKGGNGAGRGLVNIGPSSRRRGSGADLPPKDFLEQLYIKTYRTYDTTMRWSTREHLIKVVDPLRNPKAIEGGGWIMERIDPKSEKSQVAIEKFVDQMVDQGHITEDVADDIKTANKIVTGGKVSQAAINRFASRHGVDVENDVELKEAAKAVPGTVDIWTQNLSGDPSRAIIAHRSNGETHLYQVDRLFYDLAMNAPLEISTPFTTVVGMMGTVSSRLTTSWNFDFLLANLPLDWFDSNPKHAKGFAVIKSMQMLAAYAVYKAGNTESAWVGTKSIKSFTDMLRKTIRGKDAESQRALLDLLDSSGGKLFSAYSGKDAKNRVRRKLGIKAETWSEQGRRIYDATLEGVSSFEELSGITDAPVRLAEGEAIAKKLGFYAKGDKWYSTENDQEVTLPEYAKVRILNAMAEATTNFKKRGAGISQIRWAMPLIGAQLAGLRKQIEYVHNIKNIGNGTDEDYQARATLIKYAGFIAMAAAVAFSRKDDDDWKESESKYDNFEFYGDKGKVLVSLPMPRGVGGFLAGMTTSIIESIYGKPRRTPGEVAVSEVAEQVPTGGGIVKATLESLTNYSVYRNRKIVNDYMGQRSPQAQFDKSTLEPSIRVSEWIAETSVGKLLRISPIAFQYWMDQSLGGQYVKWGSYVERKLGVREADLSRDWGLRRFFPNRHQQGSLNDFYEELGGVREELKGQTARFNAGRIKKIDDSVVHRSEYLSLYEDLISDMRKEPQAIKDRIAQEMKNATPVERNAAVQKAINELGDPVGYMVGLARDALGYPELKDNKNPFYDKDAPAPVKAIIKKFMDKKVESVMLAHDIPTKALPGDASWEESYKKWEAGHEADMKWIEDHKTSPYIAQAIADTKRKPSFRDRLQGSDRPNRKATESPADYKIRYERWKKKLDVVRSWAN